MRFGGVYFRKTFFSYFLPISALIAALALFAANRLHSIRFEGEQRTLLAESRLTYDLIEADLREGSIEKVREKLQSIASAVNCRFTLIDDDGRVIADTKAANSGKPCNTLKLKVLFSQRGIRRGCVDMRHPYDREAPLAAFLVGGQRPETG